MHYGYKKNEFYHHGIVGQKWGVRRFQNKDGSLTPAGLKRYGYGSSEYVLGKGTKVYRSTTDGNESTSGHKYVTYKAIDRNYYKGAAASTLRSYRGLNNKSILYENEYRLKENLRIANDDVSSKAIIDVMNKNPKLKREVLDGYAQDLFRINRIDETLSNYKELAKDKGVNPEIRKQYADYVTRIEKAKKETLPKLMEKYGSLSIQDASHQAATQFGKIPKVRELVTKELTKQGYGGMIDIAGVGGRNGFGKEGAAPLIVFEGDNYLDKRKQRVVGEKDQAKATSKYHRDRRKL